MRSVRVLISAAGVEWGSFREVGRIYRIASAEASRMVDAGQAEYVDEPETLAEVAPVETKKQKRKGS